MFAVSKKIFFKFKDKSLNLLRHSGGVRTMIRSFVYKYAEKRPVYMCNDKYVVFIAKSESDTHAKPRVSESPSVTSKSKIER